MHLMVSPIGGYVENMLFHSDISVIIPFELG